MTQISYRGNLSSAVFPMCLAKAGRTVINPGADQNFDRRVDPSGEQKDAGIPQAIYLENVLATPNGYQSVGFKPTVAGDVPFNTGTPVLFIMKITVPLVSTLLQECALVFYSNGTAYARTAITGWGAVTISGTFPAITRTIAISWALVKGVCYIHVGTELFTFDGITLLNITGTLTGIVFTNVQSIVGAFNYLVICTYDRVYWSSTTTSTDFVPSLVSGAGSEGLGANGSWVNFVKPHSSGFMIYTLNNAIFATYTGNRAYPWKFREVANSGGFSTRFEVSEDTTNSPIQIGITNSGQVQILSQEEATIIAAEVTDYFERNVTYDVYNSTTNVITQATDTNLTLARQMYRQIQFVNDRYVIISFSNSVSDVGAIPLYRYAIVYDYLLKRYGRLKIDHSNIIAFDATGEILFVNGVTREVRQLYFDIYDQDLTNPTTSLRYQHSGVLVLGKFQYIRNVFMQMEEIELESSQANSLVGEGNQIFSVAILPSFDGKNFAAAVIPTFDAQYSADNLQSYTCHTSARNFGIAVKGAFDLNTISLTFVPGGSF